MDGQRKHGFGFGFCRAGAGDPAFLTRSQTMSMLLGVEELKLLHLSVCSESYHVARSGPLDQKFLTKNHVGRLLGPPTETLSE